MRGTRTLRKYIFPKTVCVKLACEWNGCSCKSQDSKISPARFPLGRPDQESSSLGKLKLLLLRLVTIAETCKSDWLHLFPLLILQQIRELLPNVTSFSILKMQCFLHISMQVIFLTVYIILKSLHVLIPNQAPEPFLSSHRCRCRCSHSEK